MSKGMREYYTAHPYEIGIGKNGMIYVEPESVRDIDTLNVSNGNSKIGTGKNVAVFNLPIEKTCRKDCECYKGYTDPETGKHVTPCYGCKGHFSHSGNQAIYAENFKFVMAILSEEHAVDRLTAEFMKIFTESIDFARYFEVGDIPPFKNQEFIQAVVNTALERGDTKFWLYTKKYWFINQYVKTHGGIGCIPSNLKIIFSHWRNNDGTYLEMPNPYHFPTSEFIPLGCEDLASTVTHVCPCSDPDVFENCINCTHPCYELQFGESMALLEHSTDRTKTRDKEVRESHKRIAETKKATKKKTA